MKIFHCDHCGASVGGLAETLAHDLHIVDTLETASACGLSLRPKRAAAPRVMRRDRDPEIQHAVNWNLLQCLQN